MQHTLKSRHTLRADDEAEAEAEAEPRLKPKPRLTTNCAYAFVGPEGVGGEPEGGGGCIIENTIGVQ